MLTNAYEIPFKLAAGASLVLPAGSFEFVYLSSVSSGASVRLKGSQASVDLTVGRRVEFGRSTDQPVTLENVGSGSVSGVLLVGSGRVVDSKVVGVVSVVDGGFDVVGSGLSFSSHLSQSAVAAEYSIVQLFNPSGSGRYCVVDQYNIATDTGGTIGVCGGLGELSAGVVQGIESQNIGGISGTVCSAWAESVATHPSGLTGFFLLSGASVQAGASFDKALKRPYLLGPGESLSFYSSVVNSRIDVSVFYYEIEV